MPAIKLDGKALAKTIRAEIAADVAALVNKGGPTPGLATVLVGDRPDSRAYVRNKIKACEQVGINGVLHQLPADTAQGELLELIAKLNADPATHGILVQLPLPDHIDEPTVVEAVDPRKDVDGFHPANLGLLMAGRPRFLPCTPAGCHELVTRNGIELAGKEVVIVGRSNIVGKPLASIWMQKPHDATVTVAHSRTHDLAEVTRRADVLVAAVGRPGLITPGMVKPGAAVVDVGINSVDDKLVGDVAPDVADVAGALTPVPGGVGPMTVTMLMRNTLRAAEREEGRGKREEE